MSRGANMCCSIYDFWPLAMVIWELPENDAFLPSRIKQWSDQEKINFAGWKGQFTEGERTWGMKDFTRDMHDITFSSRWLHLRELCPVNSQTSASAADRNQDSGTLKYEKCEGAACYLGHTGLLSSPVWFQPIPMHAPPSSPNRTAPTRLVGRS